jgi:hypothetical protein
MREFEFDFCVDSELPSQQVVENFFERLVKFAPVSCTLSEPEHYLRVPHTGEDQEGNYPQIGQSLAKYFRCKEERTVSRFKYTILSEAGGVEIVEVRDPTKPQDSFNVLGQQAPPSFKYFIEFHKSFQKGNKI